MRTLYSQLTVVYSNTLFLKEWQTFCNFQEIIDISIKRACHEQVPQDIRMVTVTRNDDRCLVRDTLHYKNGGKKWIISIKLYSFGYFVVLPQFSRWKCIYLSLLCTTGSQVSESQRSTVICVTCRWLLQTDHRLQSLLLPGHCPSKSSRRHWKPLSWSNDVCHFGIYWNWIPILIYCIWG